MDKTNECGNCHWRYAYNLLSPYRSFSGDVLSCCGICALALSNAETGLHRTHFGGRMAETLRQMAIAWRRNHPDLAPSKEEYGKSDTDRK